MLERQYTFRTKTFGAIARPVGKQIGRHADIADVAAMRTAIGQTHHRIRMLQQGVQMAQIVVGEVEAREINHRRAVLLHHHVIDDFQRRAPFPLGNRLDAVVLLRLVIGILAQRVHLVEALGQVRRP